MLKIHWDVNVQTLVSDTFAGRSNPRSPLHVGSDSKEGPEKYRPVLIDSGDDVDDVDDDFNDRSDDDFDEDYDQQTVRCC